MHDKVPRCSDIVFEDDVDDDNELADESADESDTGTDEVSSSEEHNTEHIEVEGAQIEDEEEGNLCK